jgi:hypothetical protein
MALSPTLTLHISSLFILGCLLILKTIPVIISIPIMGSFTSPKDNLLLIPYIVFMKNLILAMDSSNLFFSSRFTNSKIDDSRLRLLKH